MSKIVEDLRGLAVAMEQDGGWSDSDIGQIRDAADMLSFFFGQLQMHSPKMDGKHSYRFRNGGWPMTHCVGPNAEDAVRAAVQEVATRKKGLDELQRLSEELDLP